MRWIGIVAALVLLGACDQTRVFEKYQDFENGQWLASEKPEFEFIIKDTRVRYNLYGNVRNAVSYPWSRFFMNYSLQDSSGHEIQKSLASDFLFDAKSGEPLGDSGLGDIYDHRLLLLKDYQFQKTGTYKVKFEQFMRTDTLAGILAVGLRVELANGK
jgi:gliding motility-associated lipoprotein GldH